NQVLRALSGLRPEDELRALLEAQDRSTFSGDGAKGLPGGGAVRTAYRGHGAARIAAHRQPASRTQRTAGRPRIEPVLPFDQRRSHEDVHGRSDAVAVGEIRVRGR